MISRDTISRLEFNLVLAEIATHARSDATRSIIASTSPLADPDEIRVKSGRITEIRALSRLDIPLRIYPAGVSPRIPTILFQSFGDSFQRIALGIEKNRRLADEV